MLRQSASVIFLLIIMALLNSTLLAQSDSRRSFMEFKAGFLRPEDTSASNLLGLSFGRKLDDKLYYGIEANYMTSNYRKTTTITESDSGGISFTDKQLELDFRTRIMSILLQLSFESKLDAASTVFMRASAGGGLQMVWNNENNYVDQIERTRFFSWLGWQLTAGLGVPISRTGMVFVDAIYNHALLSKSQGESDLGLPTFREIDLSGFGLRAGINLIGIGM